jgi:hypothetical protein
MNENISLLFAFRNFKHQGKSHVGCGVGAENAVKVLLRAGIKAEAFPLWSKQDLVAGLKQRPDVTHFIVEAIWLTSQEVVDICASFPQVEFIIRCHSAYAFLQSEVPAIKLIRDQLELSKTIKNLVIAGNCKKFSEATAAAYGVKCAYLPNLYDVEAGKTPNTCFPSNIIRISSFGALRLLKNHVTDAVAALIVAKALGKDLEFYVNTGREEGGGQVLAALRALFVGCDRAKLVEVPWQDWKTFYKVVGQMDCGFQLSATESFNITVYDHLVQRIPVVVSPMVQWAPASFKVAVIDDPVAADAKMLHLLKRRDSGEVGARAARAEAEAGTRTWKEFLGLDEKRCWWR